MCSVFLPLFFLCQLKTGTEIECRGYVRFNLAFRSDVLAVNTNGSSGESYGARWRIRASNKGMSIAPLSRACLNTVLKPAGHQTIGKLLASVRRSKNDERRTELVTDHYLCSAYQDSKLMESCVASNITNHVVTQNVLEERQWAYRKGKSTEQLLKHLTERWRETIARRLFVGILFGDLTKAFNKVSHNILLQKLFDLGIRRDIWLWLKNYLRERR